MAGSSPYPRCSCHFKWLLQGLSGKPGARPTNNISTEFEIKWIFVMLLFIPYSVDHNEILHISRQ